MYGWTEFLGEVHTWGTEQTLAWSPDADFQGSKVNGQGWGAYETVPSPNATLSKLEKRPFPQHFSAIFQKTVIIIIQVCNDYYVNTPSHLLPVPALPPTPLHPELCKTQSEKL